MQTLPAIVSPARQLPIDGELIEPDDRSVHVVVCPSLVSSRREDHSFPAGSSLGEILRAIEPDPRMRRCFAASFDGDSRIDAKLWDRIRIKGGNALIVRAVPMGGGGSSKILRTVLMIAVTALAAAATWYIGGLGAPIAAAAVGAAILGGGCALAPSLVNSTRAPQRRRLCRSIS